MTEALLEQSPMLDQLLEQYRQNSLSYREANLRNRLSAFFDRFIYRDELEYLEMPGIPMETQVSVVDRLSRLNNRSGYIAILLWQLESLVKSCFFNTLPVYPIKILDIGVGGGGLLQSIYEWAQKKGIPVELYGNDLSRDFIRFTKKRLESQNIPVKFIHSDACHFKHIQDGSFDFVISSYMVHHIRSAAKTAAMLSEVYRISRFGWLIADFHRSFLGPLFVFLSGYLFGGNKILVDDGVKSVRRAYKSWEINLLLHELEKQAKVESMHCTKIPAFPFWMIKGTKAALPAPTTKSESFAVPSIPVLNF